MAQQNAGDLNFQANLTDNVSPQAAAIEKRLKALGANKHQIQIAIQAHDEASKKAHAVRERLKQIPAQVRTVISADVTRAHEAVDRLRARASAPVEMRVNMTDNSEQHMMMLRNKYSAFGNSVRNPFMAIPALGVAANAATSATNTVASAAGLPGLPALSAAGVGIAGIAALKPVSYTHLTLPTKRIV